MDDIGFCYDLETQVIPALNEKFAKAVRASLEEQIANGVKNLQPVLKKLLAVSKDVAALTLACQKYGATEEDCLALAGIFRQCDQFDEALEWIEKGLGLKSSVRNFELKKLKRVILSESGRRHEAFTDAWAEFQESPSIYSLEIALEWALVDEHAALKAEALPFFKDTELRTAAVALSRLAEHEILAARLREASVEHLQEISYFDAIPIAENLAVEFPNEAARLYIAQAFLILIEKRSKAYHHAHDYLQSAKVLLDRDGASEEWEKTVAQIRREHRLKSAFMPGFERIVAGLVEKSAASSSR